MLPTETTENMAAEQNYDWKVTLLGLKLSFNILQKIGRFLSEAKAVYVKESERKIKNEKEKSI